jgi:hypothetical protein
MRDEAFGEFDGVARGKMGPFGAIESRQLGKI